MFEAKAGMATLSAGGVRVMEALEDLFLAWARKCGAQQARYPALICVGDLDRLNYFRNFPQMVFCVCGLGAEQHSQYSRRARSISVIGAQDLAPSEFCLPPSACYNVYLSLQGQDLDAPRYVTTVASCFRNENHYEGLRRLRGFTMREIVCIGSAGDVRDHLSRYREIAIRFFGRLGLPVTLEVASDPFFDKQGTAARAARIMPTKEEMVYSGSLAIGSINYHRRFFGERCGITIFGEPANTGCVGFGIERWIHALSEQFGPDPDRIINELESARFSLS